MNEFWKRISNTKSIMAIAGLIGLLLNQFGVSIDLLWLDTTVNLVCALLVILGVINNEGMTSTEWNK